MSREKCSSPPSDRVQHDGVGSIRLLSWYAGLVLVGRVLSGLAMAGGAATRSDDELETLPRPPAFTTLLREEPLVLPRQDPPRDAGVPPVPPLPPRVMPLHELALERAELLPLHELHTRGVARRLALDRAIALAMHAKFS